MLKKEIKIVSKKGINYQLENGKKLKFKPWLGDFLSFKYDSIMEKSIFPKKFNADIFKHFDFLKSALKEIKERSVLELACGSGSLSGQLPAENSYTGIDISPALIKIAIQKFKTAGFKTPEFFISDVSALPFEADSYDYCICSLSLNFFPDTEKTVKEIFRILKPGGSFFCTVPVSERTPEGSIIRGTMLSEKGLQKLFTETGFSFTEYDFSNGAVFYFKTVKQ